MKSLIAFAFLPLVLLAQTGYDIAEQMDGKKKPDDMRADLTMVQTNKRGKTRTSTIRSVSKDGGKKQMIWFLSPADDKGVAFLKIEHEGQDDEMRLWLPAFKKVKRILAKQKGDAFMGSDLNYEDMTNRELNEYSYKRLDDDVVDDRNCFVLESSPKPEAKSTYSKHITWVTQDDLTAIREESYDRAGILLKKKTLVYQQIKGYQTPKEIYVENVQKKHSTRLTFDNIRLDTGVSDDQFQEKNLKRLPRGD